MQSLKCSNVITRWTDRLCVVHSHGRDTSDLGVFPYRCKVAQGEVSMIQCINAEPDFLYEVERNFFPFISYLFFIMR